MYRNLRHLIAHANGSDETASVHYLMLPVARDDYIDEDMERAVSRMQAVIELGRVVRDRRTMPMKVGLLIDCVY